MTPIILLADDHIMICRALRKLIEIDFGYREVESATSCTAIMKLLRKRKFTHLVIDIGLSDGSVLEILPVIKELYPDLRVMVYTARPCGVYERGAQKFGIGHFLAKDAGELESIKQFRLFLEDRPQRQVKVSPGDSPFSKLTDRQLQVLHYLLDGRSGMEIAGALNVTKSTISTLKGQVLERTGARNILELMALADLYKIK